MKFQLVTQEERQICRDKIKDVRFMEVLKIRSLFALQVNLLQASLA